MNLKGGHGVSCNSAIWTGVHKFSLSLHENTITNVLWETGQERTSVSHINDAILGHGNRRNGLESRIGREQRFGIAQPVVSADNGRRIHVRADVRRLPAQTQSTDVVESWRRSTGAACRGRRLICRTASVGSTTSGIGRCGECGLGAR